MRLDLGFSAPVKNVLPYDGGAEYFGAIVTPEAATSYLDALRDTIAWEHDTLVIYGRRIVTARQTAWYGDRPWAYTYSHTTKVALPWTAELLAIKALVEEVSGECYNSCLLNRYRDGREGMGWHSDDEDTIGPGSAIASVSLGAERRFDLRHKTTREKVSLLLAHGSLLVMRGATQQHWQHSLPKSTRIGTSRVNLTFRQMVEGTTNG
jgi:alkylated DNA repair dioxygenase AlkB